MTRKGTQTLLLSQRQVEEMLSVREANLAVRDTFIDLSEGTVKNPAKVTLDLGQYDSWPADEGFVNAMPAYLGREDMAGIKWVSGTGGERRKAGLPYINAMILLMDPHLGEFVAVMDGTAISNLRTGAQVANTLRALAPDRNHLSLGIYGAGTQAQMTLRACADLFTIDRLDIWNRHQAGAEKLAEAAASAQAAQDIHVVPEDHPEDAAGNPFTVTATSSSQPILSADWFHSGQVIIPLGSGQEVPADLALAADRLYVDQVDQVMHRGCLVPLFESGQLDRSAITATLGDLVAGKVQPEGLDHSLTLAIPVGTGAMDIALACRVYRKACQSDQFTRFVFQDEGEKPTSSQAD